MKLVGVGLTEENYEKYSKKLKKAVAAGLILLIGLFTLTACSKTKQTKG